MGKTIQIEVSEEEFKELRAVKYRHGLTWYGMLRSGAIYLEETQPDLH